MSINQEEKHNFKIISMAISLFLKSGELKNQIKHKMKKKYNKTAIEVKFQSNNNN